MFLKIVETKGFYGASLPSSILIVNILKQSKKFSKYNGDSFWNFDHLKTFPVKSHTKVGPDRFRAFWRLFDINKQTNRQDKYNHLKALKID